MKKRIYWKVLVLCLIIVFGITFIGGLFVSSNSNSDWYLENKPSLTPPSWVFGPVWTLLYFLISLSLYFAWINSNKKEKKILAIVFGINLIANSFWSYLFFGIQNPLLSFLDLLVIFGTIIGMIFITGKIKKTAAWLLLPYLLWVGFAGILNFLFI